MASHEDIKASIASHDEELKKLQEKMGKIALEKKNLIDQGRKMRIDAIDLSSLSDGQISIVSDMIDEWLDRDRHGQLYYDSDQAEAFEDISGAVHAEMKNRKMIY